MKIHNQEHSQRTVQIYMRYSRMQRVNVIPLDVAIELAARELGLPPCND